MQNVITPLNDEATFKHDGTDVTIKSERPMIAIKGNWSVVWEQASVVRINKVKVETPRLMGGTGVDKPVTVDSEQPSKKIKPGVFTMRCERLNDKCVAINFKHIAGCWELLGKMQSEFDGKVELTVPDLLSLVNDSTSTNIGSAKLMSNMHGKSKWQDCCKHNDFTDLLE